MIGFVVMIFAYEGASLDGDPTKLYLDRAAAEKRAKAVTRCGRGSPLGSSSGEVWEVDLSELPMETLAALP